MVLFGAWYFSDVVAELATEFGWTVIGRVDPEPPSRTRTLWEVPKGVACFVAIGDNKQREYVTSQLELHSRRIVSMVHASAVVSRSAIISAGSFIGDTQSSEQAAAWARVSSSMPAP